MKALISICGPTASGKTRQAIRLARRLGAPVISADSRQLYRGLEIGSAKPDAAERAAAEHYMLDAFDPDEQCSAADFAARVIPLLRQLFESHDTVLMAGGSGFYFDAVWFTLDEFPEVPASIRKDLQLEFETKGLGPLIEELREADPETMAQIDRRNPARVIRALEVWRASGKPISSFRTGRKPAGHPWTDIRLGLTMERALLHARIAERVDAMMVAGLEGEARGLIERYGADAPGLQSVGYKEFVPYLGGEYDLDRAVELIKRNTRRLARRQYTWFRRYEDLRWFDHHDDKGIDTWLDARLGISM